MADDCGSSLNNDDCQKNESNEDRMLREESKIQSRATIRTDTSGKSGRKRHGANNQHKMKDFVRWLLKTFHNELSTTREDNNNNNNNSNNAIVLDVAGGRGELAARLTMCHNIHVILIDPRTDVNITKVYMQVVVPRLPNKWQQKLKHHIQNNPIFVETILKDRFQHYTLYFTNETIEKNDIIKNAIQKCSIIVGMHADSATECIVDIALEYDKPFVVIPCCVFPNLFQQRFIIDITSGKKIPVRNYEQFCDYLLNKDKRFRKSVLPFEGRNVAIWWDGK